MCVWSTVAVGNKGSGSGFQTNRGDVINANPGDPIGSVVYGARQNLRCVTGSRLELMSRQMEIGGSGGKVRKEGFRGGGSVMAAEEGFLGMGREEGRRPHCLAGSAHLSHTHRSTWKNRWQEIAGAVALGAERRPVVDVTVRRDRGSRIGLARRSLTEC